MGFKRTNGDYTFSEQNGKTTARITIYNESLARMEKMIERQGKQPIILYLYERTRTNQRVYC